MGVGQPCNVHAPQLVGGIMEAWVIFCKVCSKSQDLAVVHLAEVLWSNNSTLFHNFNCCCCLG